MKSEPTSFAGNAAGDDAMALYERVMQGPMQARIPEVIKSTLGKRPDIYAAIMAAGRPILFEGSLPSSVKQMIVLLVARTRNCAFCTDAHQAILEAMGIERALIENCLADPAMQLLPPMYRHIIQFALEIAEDPDHVDDRQFECLRDSGLNEAEILEAAMAASFATFLVTWSDVRVGLND